MVRTLNWAKDHPHVIHPVLALLGTSLGILAIKMVFG
jgi:hypothetical protein